MQRHGVRSFVVLFGIGMALSGPGLRSANAQASSNQSQESTGKPTSNNDLQRSVEIYSYRVAAKSGAARGEVIYYYKCWVCHNSYTRAPDHPLLL